MALDLKAWLVEMGVPSDKIDGLLPALSDPAVAANIEKTGLRLSDYSRQMTGLQSKQAELDAANERLNLEMVEWAETRNQGGEVTEAMRRDLAKAQGEVTRLKSIVTTKATELGLDPKTVIGEEAPPARVDPPPAAVPNLDGYVKQDQLGAYGRFQLMLARDLPRIQHEHQQLTGEWLDPGAIISEFETRASDRLNRNADGTFKKAIDLRAIWEEKFDVAAKRTAKDMATREAEREAAREEGRQEIRSQAALPGQQAPGRHAPIFTRPGNADPAKTPRPSQVANADRISKAASALATHRYRTTMVPATGRG
jgi:hypothetical protein